MNRPANYSDLLSSEKMMVDDHIRAGVEPPKFEVTKYKAETPEPWTGDICDD